MIALEPYTTITEKSCYDGSTTYGLANLQPSTLTYPTDHVVLVEGKGSTTIPIQGNELENKGGNPEYSLQ